MFFFFFKQKCLLIFQGYLHWLFCILHITLEVLKGIGLLFYSLSLDPWDYPSEPGRRPFPCTERHPRATGIKTHYQI